MPKHTHVGCSLVSPDRTFVPCAVLLPRCSLNASVSSTEEVRDDQLCAEFDFVSTVLHTLLGVPPKYVVLPILTCNRSFGGDDVRRVPFYPADEPSTLSAPLTKGGVGACARLRYDSILARQREQHHHNTKNHTNNTPFQLITNGPSPSNRGRSPVLNAL